MFLNDGANIDINSETTKLFGHLIKINANLPNKNQFYDAFPPLFRYFSTFIRIFGLRS